ncbi:hypothetical protein COU59_01435 [Candidatus Pacearchaeota archaeon CG10_big_fil_rev_8_21_14_0_10_34_12]|nr:MAG: hypothetical protein COU59_01435 [Candidatus Pacearchaeota archaeon CG10_big_fil_rev_8_21_14_0_10_34_12]
MKKRVIRRIKTNAKKTKNDWLFVISGIIFLVVSFLHLIRVLMGWSLMIENQIVPLWISGVAVIATGFLGTKLLMVGCR